MAPAAKMAANHKPARPAAVAESCNRAKAFSSCKRPARPAKAAAPSFQTLATPATDKGLKPKQTKLTINIPAGAEDGNRLRVRGEGEPSTEGGPRGDLYVYLSVKPHEHFERDGLTVYYAAPITYAQASLGGKIEVPTINGSGTLTIPAGSQPGDKLRLRGAGVKEGGSGRTGDQIVILDLKVPKKPSGRYKELLEEMATIEREQAGTEPETNHGFWDKLKSFF